jgi:sterol carrier protein 2
MPSRKTYIIGVGKTKYEKPRNRIGYEELGLQAATKALLDAGIKCFYTLHVANSR